MTQGVATQRQSAAHIGFATRHSVGPRSTHGRLIAASALQSNVSVNQQQHMLSLVVHVPVSAVCEALIAAAGLERWGFSPWLELWMPKSSSCRGLQLVSLGG